MNRKLMLPLGLLVFACESKEPAPTPQPAAPPPAAPSSAAAKAETTIAQAPAPVDLESVPVEEDFEQEAATQVDAKNLKATLDALEKEIATE
ncbi:MAG TPA: hypothetical protein VNN80_09585 [Polyangiaceae bacterium]|nr:hypothetical protein [Polyangiaceae bacterium]